MPMTSMPSPRHRQIFFFTRCSSERQQQISLCTFVYYCITKSIMMTNSSIYFDFTVTLVVCWLTACSNAFHTNVRPNQRAALLRPVSLGISSSSSDDNHHRQNPVVTLSRRSLFHKSLTSITTTATITSSSLLLFPLPALAKSLKDASLESLLYTLLRVREALTQETRLIQTGKFKDVQRANVKLAVRFMLKNYRLSDTLVAASAKLESPAQRLAAADVGNSIVETLYTILEYFDASNVENLKVNTIGVLLCDTYIVCDDESGGVVYDLMCSFAPFIYIYICRWVALITWRGKKNW